MGREDKEQEGISAEMETVIVKSHTHSVFILLVIFLNY